MISTPAPTRLQNSLDPTAFCNEVRHLSKEKLREIDQLYCIPAHINVETRARVRQWYRDQGITNAKGESLKGKKLQDSAKPMVKRFAIFLTNRVSMTAVDGGPRTGLFPLYSRINHSCVPNAENHFNPTLGRLTLHACRDIEAGEQILVSYIGSSSFRTRKQRADELSDWEITCGCAACIDPAIDVLRHRCFELDQGLAAYENAAQASKVGSIILPLLASCIPRSPAEALKLAEELVQLLERQELTGMELCNT